MPSDIKTILDPLQVPQEVKAQAWEAFNSSQDKAAFQSQFDSLPLPKEAKAALWEMKFSGGGTQSPDKKEAWSLKNFDFSGGLIPAGKAIGRAVMGNYRPLLEGGGAAVGGVVGTGTPLTSFGGAGLGFAGGRAAANLIDELRAPSSGESLGRQLGHVPVDIGEGAAYEMGGQAIGRAVSGIGSAWRTLKNFLGGAADERVMKLAGKELSDITSKGARFDANAAEARQIEDVTGARFTRGQRANDPKTIAYERGQAARGGEFAVNTKEQQAEVNDALRKYFGREFSTGEVDDLLKFVDAKSQGLQQGVKTAEGAVQTEAARLRPASTAMDRGLTIQKGLESAKQTAKAAVKQAYEKVPGGTPINIDSLAAKVKNLKDIGESLIPNYEREHTIPSIVTDLSKKLNKTAKALDEAATPDLGPDLLDVIMDEGGILAKSQVKPGSVGAGMYDNFEGIPTWITNKTGRGLDDLRQSLNGRGFDFGSVDELKDAIRATTEYRLSSGGQTEPMFADFRSLRNLRSQTLAAIRDAEAVGDATVKTGKLKQLQSAIEESIDSLADEGGKPEVVQAYREASAKYRDYATKFKQGAVGRVLQKGPRGELSRVEPEKVAGLFTSPKQTTAIGQLKRAGGASGEIQQGVKEEFSDNLLTFADDGQGGLVPAKVSLWFKKHSEALARHGLRGEYTGLEAAVKGSQAAKGRLGEFEKSFTSKTIDVDVPKAMDAAFEGRGQRRTAQVATDILKAVKGDAKAEAGAGRAFSDMLWNKMRNTGIDLAGNRQMSVAKKTNVLEQYKPAVQVFYADQSAKVKALETVQRAFQIANRSNIPITSGSDTAEKVGAVMAGYAGRLATNKLSGYPLFKGIYEYVGKRNAKQVEQLLMRATFDPDFAQTVLWAYQKYPKALIEKRLTQHWATLALASTSRTREE